MPRNLRSEIVAFLRYATGAGPRHLRWDEHGARSDGTPATVLVVEDMIPRPPFRRRASLRLTVTSSAHRLLSSRFGADAARAINAVGAKGHGRTLTCLAGGEPIAALAFHLDEDAVILVTAVAVLKPSADVETELSRAMAGVLLCYLAAAAGARGLPQRLGFAPSDPALAVALGFERTSPPSAYRAAGERYLEWRPPAPLSSLFAGG